MPPGLVLYPVAAKPLNVKGSIKGAEEESGPLFTVLRIVRDARFARLEENEEAVDAFELRRRCSELFNSVNSYSSDKLRTRELLRECAGVGRGVGFGVVDGVFARERSGERW